MNMTCRVLFKSPVMEKAVILKGAYEGRDSQAAPTWIEGRVIMQRSHHGHQ